jgi:hypothetical protein
MNGDDINRSAGPVHALSQGYVSKRNREVSTMWKIVASAGLATVLGFAMLPASAYAMPAKPAVSLQGSGLVTEAHGRNHHYHKQHHHHGKRYYRPPPPVVYHHHQQVRPWNYWRPQVMRRHYHSFGAPVYYNAHRHYGPYYRVRAHDRSDVALWLGISAITGAILFSHY